jgi:predicted metalloprotease with PDZ domain
MNVISYQITPENPNNHLFKVTITFDTKAGTVYQLSLPAWLPGSYMIRDFAKNIIEISAKDQQKQTISLTKIDKQSWQLTAPNNKITIEYQVFAFDLSVRTAYLDNQRAFFNGSSTFLAISSNEPSITSTEVPVNNQQQPLNLPCHLTINPAKSHDNWRVATGLTRATSTKKYAFGEYIAQNYAELIDCPVALGDFDSFEFTVEGVVHHMVFTGRHYGDRQRIADDVSKLCQHHINVFGEAPFKEYWFITHLLASGFGGLEHKNSTILQASRFDLPNPNKPEEQSEHYKTFLSLCSHEYFHAWNICRIKPKTFMPYNLQTESYTTQLWAYEGITSYYDDFSLYRTGLINFDEYLTLLSKTATRVFRGKGELKQTVSESSFYTWTKFYQQGADAVNNIVSYYTKGALIALWLDLTIRAKSQGKYSLDTLMREVWIHFGRPQIGTQEEDFINITNILIGEDISETFKKLLHSAERVDLTPLLAEVGVDFSPQKFAKLNELATTASSNYQAYFGAHYKECPLGVKINQIIEDSPACEAGLAVNDILIAVDHTQVTAKSLQQLADHIGKNNPVVCHYFRDDLLITSELTFTDSPLAGISIKVLDEEKVKHWQTIV